jgi:hypothetical protein
MAVWQSLSRNSSKGFVKPSMKLEWEDPDHHVRSDPHGIAIQPQGKKQGSIRDWQLTPGYGYKFLNQV